MYKKFRCIFEREFTPLLGLNKNNWKAISVSYSDINDKGYHYRDYTNFSSCRTFYPVEKGDNGRIEIGAYGFCPYCGEEYCSSERLGHSSCSIPQYAYGKTATVDDTAVVLNTASVDVNANATSIDWSNVATISAVDPILAYGAEPITFEYNPTINLDNLDELLNSVRVDSRWTMTLGTDDAITFHYE